jgi:hypothetical protein
MQDSAAKSSGTLTYAWLGLLLPSAAWAVTLEAVYLTNGYSCAGTNVGWSHLSSALGLVFCLIGGVIAWWSLGAAGDSRNRATVIHFMGKLGVGSAVLFALLTIAQWLPLIYAIPCNK